MDCNNGSHQNSDTEAILATTELEGELKNDINLDSVDDANVSVQNEICRGNKLRNEKPRHTETVSNIVCLGTFVKQPRRRKGHLDFSNINKRPSTHTSRCLCPRPNSLASTYLACSKISNTNLEQTKTKKGKRCSLRIAELAVPSKRQCIETWREKSDVLPGFMVDRLKQHVMDQIPLVKIQEAIYCFQSGKHVSSLSSKKWLSCKQKEYEAQKPSPEMDSRMLCILFAHRVAQRLSRPFKLTSNSYLEKLTKIVSKDIAQLMYKCLGTYSKDGQYKAVHTDVTNKITFWITGILEDSYMKLLEEDLRVKMKTEDITQTMLEISKPLVAIAKSDIEQESPKKSKDLEEEEGPVLDFIDDVVDNVLNICVPPQPHVDSDSSYSSGSKQDIMGEESEKSLDFSDKKNNSVDSPDSHIDSNLVLSNAEHFRNEIGKIIYNITKESINGLGNDTEIVSRDNIENGINVGNDEEFSPMKEMEYETSLEAGIDHDLDMQTNNSGISLEAGIEPVLDERMNNSGISLETGMEDDMDKRTNNTRISLEAGIEDDIDKRTNNTGVSEAGTEHNIDKRSANNTGISLEEGIEHDINDENFDHLYENSPNVDASDNADKTHSNVSARFEIVNDDSKTDLVTAYNFFEKIKTNTTEEQKANKHKTTQWYYQNNKSNIIFAEPNEDLLSDADESWPTDFGDRPILKMSDSVSKSVSSLGIITEYDENIMRSPEDETSMVNKGTGDTRLQVNAVNQILDNMLPTGKHDAASQLSDPLMKASIETSTKDPAVKQVGSKSLDEKDNSKTITVKKTNHDKPVDESFKLEKRQKESEESERESSTADTTEDDNIFEKMQSKVDLGWKVHLKTAPSWVHAWGQGRGEPSEDSIPIKKRPTKVTESELRIWCKDLEKAFIDLGIWSDWISNTCKESLYILKQKKLACPCLAKKSATNWMRLKKSVHKDALLWTKLYQRTDNSFKNLKRKYNNVEYSNPTQVSNRIIFEKMREFENKFLRLRVELHKMIVSAEYCTMCTCEKTKTTYNTNKECRGDSTKRKNNIHYTTCRHA